MEKVRHILNEGVENINERYAGFFNCTLLQYAAIKGFYEILKELLIHGADVNCQDDGGRTALICTSHGGHRNLVKELLKHRADVNKRDKLGCTALIFAASKGHTEIMRDLLDHGADVNIKNEEGNTALHIILKEQITDAKINIMKLLFSNNADIEEVNNQNKSAMQLAKESRNPAIINLMEEFSEQKKIDVQEKKLEETTKSKKKHEVNKIILRRKNKLKEISFLNDEVENLRQGIIKNECESKKLKEKISQLKCTLKTKTEDKDFKLFEKLKKDIECYERLVLAEKFDDVIQLIQRECSICFKKKWSNQNMYKCQTGVTICEVCCLRIKGGNNICPLCFKNHVETPIQDRGLTFDETQGDKNFLKPGYIFIAIIVTVCLLSIILQNFFERK